MEVELTLDKAMVKYLIDELSKQKLPTVGEHTLKRLREMFEALDKHEVQRLRCMSHTRAMSAFIGRNNATSNGCRLCAPADARVPHGGQPMIFPEEKPVERFTPHHVKMSERMSRAYGWLNANGIHLTPFSTDECVEVYWTNGAWERLRAALIVNNKVDEVIKNQVLGDCDCIMKRRPMDRFRNPPLKNGVATVPAPKRKIREW